MRYNGVLWAMGVKFLDSMLVFSFAWLFGKMHNRWVLYLVSGLFLFNTNYIAYLPGMLLADMYAWGCRKTVVINNGVILLDLWGQGSS